VPAFRTGEPLFLGVEDYCNAAGLDKLHRRLAKERVLRVHPDDIQYLILPFDKGEDQVVALHQYLKKLYRPRDAVLVTTTIMTSDRLYEDV
jgi:hypothetical protein